MDPTADAIDQTKENIQPLSQGRKTCQFGAALQAQTNTDLRREFRKTIENFELKLRTYEGDDPLSPWTEYVSWIEQSFPKGGKEGNLKSILENCLTKFKDETRYMQDLRLIKLWIKFIDLRDDPKDRCEIYQMAYNHGIGTNSALFFRFWAYELQCCGDDKAANSIFQLGLNRCAQPSEELERAHSTFLQAIGERALGNDPPPPQRPDLQDQRHVMSALRPHGANTQHVPNMRVGANILRLEPGVLPLSANANRPQRGEIAVFNDENECSTGPAVAEVRMHSLPTRAVTNKENNLQAGPWNGPARSGRCPTKQLQQQKAAVSRTTFNVHSDMPSVEPHLPVPKSCITNALKTRREDDVGRPFSMFQPPNQSECTMYAKDKVYAGGQEFSLEELRALRYFKKRCQDEVQGVAIPKTANIRFVPTPTKDKLDVVTQELSVLVDRVSNVGASDNFGQDESTEGSERRHTQLKVNKLEPELSISHNTSRSIQPPSVRSNRKTDHSRRIIIETNLIETEIQETTSKSSDTKFPQSSTASKSTSTRGQPTPASRQSAITSSQFSNSKKLGYNDSCVKQDYNSVLSAKKSESSWPLNTVLESELVKSAFKGNSCPIPNPHQNAQHYRRTTNGTTAFVKAAGVECNEVKSQVRRETMYFPASDHRRSPLLERKRDVSLASDSNASDEPSMLHSQSITVNTKEAMSVMNEMWRDNETKSPTLESRKQSFCRRSTLVSSPSSPLVKKPCLVKEVPFTPFKIFTDDIDDNENKPQDLTTNSKLMPSVEGVSPTEHNNQSKMLLMTHTNKHSTVKYEVYQDEVEDEAEEPMLESMLPPMPSIPFVASPGISSSQQQELHYADSKENQMPLGYEVHDEEPRDMAGVLEPSLHIPYEPVEPEMEYNAVECVTQALTAAFKLPLVASTPFHGHQTSNKYSMDTSLCSPESVQRGRSPEPLIDQPRHTESTSTVPQVSSSQATCNLSIIMEASKESISSNSRSSSSSGANTRRITFGTSHWTTSSNTTENQTCKSEFRGPHETLSVIEELYKEYDSSATSSKASEKPEESVIKAEPDKFYIYEETNSVPDRMPAQDQFTVPFQVDCFDIDVFNSPEENRAGYKARGGLFVAQESNSISYTHADSRSKVSVTLEEQKENVRYYMNNVDEGNDYDVEESLHDFHVKNNQASDFLTLGNKDIDTERSLVSLSANLCQLSCDDQPDINPFDPELICNLLSHIMLPSRSYCCLHRSMPTSFKAGNLLTIGTEIYDLVGVLGKGSYAKVVKAVDKGGQFKALKVQKPAWVWEFYVISELHRRLKDPTMVKAFMCVDMCFEFNNGSILISDMAEYGTVLEAASLMRVVPQVREIEPLSIYWTIEMLRIIENLHACSIVHADVKPDNFVLRSLPMANATEPSLQLIDFGRAIDLSLFPTGTAFKQVVTTKGFQCVEMQTGQPWTYQTDLYGLASTVHCLLFGDYMNAVIVNGRWNISKKIPRYFNEPLWDEFFFELLNIESCKKMPNLKKIRQNFQQVWEQTPQHTCFNFFAKLVRNQRSSKRF